MQARLSSTFLVDLVPVFLVEPPVHLAPLPSVLAPLQLVQLPPLPQLSVSHANRYSKI